MPQSTRSLSDLSRVHQVFIVVYQVVNHNIITCRIAYVQDIYWLPSFCSCWDRIYEWSVPGRRESTLCWGMCSSDQWHSWEEGDCISDYREWLCSWLVWVRQESVCVSVILTVDWSSLVPGRKYWAWYTIIKYCKWSITYWAPCMYNQIAGIEVVHYRR